MGDFKKEKYSVRTFHTYLARCSLSIAKLLCFFFREKYFFSVIFCFGFSRFVSRKPEVAGSAVASASVMEFTAPFGRASACARTCVCVCNVRVRPFAGADNFWIDV